MKRLISLTLVLALVCLCGCTAKEPENSEPVSVPSITEFAETTLMADDVLTLRILSATATTADDGSEGVGVTYDMEFKNMTYYPIKVELSNVTVNDQPLEDTLSVDVGKNGTATSAFVLKSEPLETLGIEKVEKVGLHVKVLNTERWSAPAMTERDLVFYTPLAPTAATATATAAS